jgi:hypothetical protein
MSTEVITTADKSRRDSLFADLRLNGNELERQVVKFSGNEPTDAAPRIVRYAPNAKPQYRPVYRSTWSVAYPQQ